MLGSPRFQVRSLLASSAAARAAAAGCRLDRSREGRFGRAARPGSLARGPESGIGCGAGTPPCPGFVPRRGARRVERIPAAATTRVQVSRGAGVEGRPPGPEPLDLTQSRGPGLTSVDGGRAARARGRERTPRGVARTWRAVPRGR